MTRPAALPANATDAPDLESRLQSGDSHSLHLWLRMASCCTLIENELRRRLRTQFDTTLPRFDLMAQLAQANEGMKMTDLSRQMMVSSGNITGIADQLERSGLIRRVRPEKDRRSTLVYLTPKGRATFAKISEAHEQWLNELFSGLQESRSHRLLDMLGELKHIARTHLANGASP